MSSSANSPQIVPLRKGVNFAPVKPLLALDEDRPQSHYVCDALKERYKHFWSLEASVWREMVAAGELVAHFIAGDQLIERNPWTGGWLVIKPQRQDESTQRALNMMQYFVTNCLTKWHQSNPDVVAKPGRDNDQAVMAAKAGDTIVGHYEGQFFKPWFNLQEGLQALTFGTYLGRLRYDAGVKGVVGLREVVENREIKLGDGAGYCGDCEHAGPAQDFAGQIVAPDGEPASSLCPRCGSDAVLVEPPATDNVPTVTGQEPVELGDLVYESLPFPACRWDLTRRAEWSSWFIYQQRVSFGAVRRLLGRVKLPGEEAGQVDLGEHVIKGLAYSGQAVGGKSGQGKQQRQSQDHATLCEMWLSPEDYVDITLKGDEQTIDGEQLPTGANLADLFPDGLVAVGLNGFNVTLGIYAEKHIDHVTSGVWHMKPLSGAGRGMTDSVEVQRRLNKLDSQQLAYMDAAATPATLFDQTLLGEDDAQYLGNPRANIPVDLRQLPDTTKLHDAVMQLAPASVPGQFVQYVQQFLTQAFATTSHATDFTNGGIVGERNDTARAAMIADANANSIFGPLLAVKGETRQRVAEMTVALYREHFPIKRYFSLGGAYSEQPGLWLSSADLKGDIRFETVRESELPQNSITKQDKTISFFALFGGFDGYAAAQQAFPELVADLAKLWNVSIQGAGFDVSAQVCRRRLEQIKQGVQMAAGMPVPPEVLIEFIQPPISPVENAHPDKAKWWQTWLDTDEGLNAQLELRAAVELLVRIHFEMVGFQESAKAALAGQVQSAQAATAPQQQPAQKGTPK